MTYKLCSWIIDKFDYTIEMDWSKTYACALIFIFTNNGHLTLIVTTVGYLDVRIVVVWYVLDYLFIIIYKFTTILYVTVQEVNKVNDIYTLVGQEEKW